MTLSGINKTLIIVSIPFVYLCISLNLLTTSGFLQIAYNSGLVSQDPYGLTNSQRTSLATQTLSLVKQNPPAISEMLGELALPQGGSLYSPDEVDHLVDVANLLARVNYLGIITSLFIIILIVWPYLIKADINISRLINEGSRLALFTVISLVLFMLLAWSQFFNLFHRLMFPPDTWIFASSTGLIRLYPESFWQLFAASLVSLIIIMSTAILILLSLYSRYHQKSLNINSSF